MAIVHKSFETEQTVIKAEAPDLAAIRKYALREVNEGDVFTGSMKLCHDRYDRTHERYTKAYLDRFAETLPGKAVMPGHDYSALPLGRFYAASVVPDSEGHHLKVSYYLPKDSPLVPQIELGVLKDVSIGFNAGRRLCDLCGDTWRAEKCDHWPGQEYDGQKCTLTYCETEAHKAEAMEGSFVWCGAQPGAEAVAMAAKTHLSGLTEEQRRFWMIGYGFGTSPGQISVPSDFAREESGMQFKSIEEAEVEIKRLQALPLAADRETELQKQISELMAKAPLADDGVKYRAHLNTEIGRLAGLLGKTATYERLLTHMKDAGADSLQPVLDELLTEYDAKFSGGVAHTGAPNETGSEPKRRGLMARMAGGNL